jgi:hypothetical protein
MARYRVNPTLLAFLPRKRGQAVGSRRLNPAREAILEEAVDKWMASREPLPISRAVEEAVRLTKAAGLKSIARSAIVIDTARRERPRCPHNFIYSYPCLPSAVLDRKFVSGLLQSLIANPFETLFI